MSSAKPSNLQVITPREIRVWVLVLGCALSAVGLIQYLVWDHQRAAQLFWILALAFLISGLVLPMALKPVYRLWLKFAAVLAWINTRLILSLTFFLVFTPLGFLLRLLGKDLLKEKWEAQAKSYWVERKPIPFDPSRYEKQF